MSILRYGCTTPTLIKYIEKKLDGNHIRILLAVLKKKTLKHNPWKKNSCMATYLPSQKPYKSDDELISDVFLWAPTYGLASVGWPARSYLLQLCEDTGCSLEDLPQVRHNRDGEREREREIQHDMLMTIYTYRHRHTGTHTHTHTHTHTYIYIIIIMSCS